MTEPVAPLSISSLVLQAKQMEIDAARQLATRADLLDVLGQLIQCLQRERGASSIYLASSGARFAEERCAIVEQSRKAEALVRQAFTQHADASQGATARSLSLMAWALLGLDAMEALRIQIEHRAIGAHDLVAAVSHLLAGLIELVFIQADAVAVPSVSRQLVALLHLVQAQEEAGQERAVGALLYGSGQADEAHQQRVLHLIDAQERSLAVFVDFADNALIQRWEGYQLTPSTARLERLRRTLCTARSGTPLDSDLSNPWFDVCTERIDGLWQLQSDLIERLRQDCAAYVIDAQRDLQDSKGLLRRLRDNPPPRTQAVDRFFDIALAPAITRTPEAGAGEPASLQALVQTQAARMAAMETELESARGTLNERKVIERAKGVLMAKLGITEDVAFRALQKASMDQNRRLLNVAESMLTASEPAIAQLVAQVHKIQR